MTSPPPRHATLPSGTPAHDPSDTELLTASAQGDRSAFGVLMRRHLRSATALAFELLGDLDDAEDAVQDAFVAVLRRAADFDVSLPFPPWLFGIVRNMARRRLERASRRLRLLQRWAPRQHDVQPHPADAANDGSDADLIAQVDTIVHALPDMQRQCFTLHVRQGVPVADVAAMFDIAESTVRQHVFRARAVLRERLATPQDE